MNERTSKRKKPHLKQKLVYTSKKNLPSTPNQNTGRASQNNQPFLTSRNQNLKNKFEEFSKQMKKTPDIYYLGSQCQMDKNEDTKFKILNAKNQRQPKSKTKINESHLTDNNTRDLKESKMKYQKLALQNRKTNSKNKISQIPKKLLKNFRKENRSLEAIKPKMLLSSKEIGLNQLKSQKHLKNCISNQMIPDSSTATVVDKSSDKRKFYLSKNLKVLKSKKLSRTKLNGQSLLTSGVKSGIKKKLNINGSQDNFKTQEGNMYRLKPSKINLIRTSKNGLKVIKNRFDSKKLFLKARSFDKSRNLCDQNLNGFTFGK